MVASSAVADRNAVIEPSGAATLSPEICSPTRPSLMSSRVASQAPSAISQTAEPDAPKKTAPMMPRAGVGARHVARVVRHVGRVGDVVGGGHRELGHEGGEDEAARVGGRVAGRRAR